MFWWPATKSYTIIIPDKDTRLEGQNIGWQILVLYIYYFKTIQARVESIHVYVLDFSHKNKMIK